MVRFVFDKVSGRPRITHISAWKSSLAANPGLAGPPFYGPGMLEVHVRILTKGEIT